MSVCSSAEESGRKPDTRSEPRSATPESARDAKAGTGAGAGAGAGARVLLRAGTEFLGALAALAVAREPRAGPNMLRARAILSAADSSPRGVAAVDGRRSTGAGRSIERRPP